MGPIHGRISSRQSVPSQRWCVSTTWPRVFALVVPTQRAATARAGRATARRLNTLASAPVPAPTFVRPYGLPPSSGPWAVREGAGDTGPKPPRLLDQVRHRARARHYSRRTEKAYAGWIRRFILFHGKRHPTMMGAGDIARFLTWLAVERRVSAGGTTSTRPSSSPPPATPFVTPSPLTSSRRGTTSGPCNSSLATRTSPPR